MENINLSVVLFSTKCEAKYQHDKVKMGRKCGTCYRKMLKYLRKRSDGVCLVKNS
jgi:hypothetical protein